MERRGAGRRRQHAFGDDAEGAAFEVRGIDGVFEEAGEGLAGFAVAGSAMDETGVSMESGHGGGLLCETRGHPVVAILPAQPPEFTHGREILGLPGRAGTLKCRIRGQRGGACLESWACRRGGFPGLKRREAI